MPSPSELNRNPFLENFSVGAFTSGSVPGSGGYLARAIMPVLPVEDDAGKYHIVNMDDIMRDEMTVRQPGTPVPMSDFKFSTDTYLTQQWSTGVPLTEELLAKDYAALGLEQAAMDIANERGLINQEIQFKNSFWKTGVWARDMVGAGSSVADTSYKYWSSSSTTPIDDILAEGELMKVRGWRYPNVLALGAKTARKLTTNDQILARLNNGQTPGGPAQASLADLGRLFTPAIPGAEPVKVIVAGASYNSAAQGATASKGFILDDDCAWLGYVASTVTKLTLTAGVTITYRKLAGNPQGVRVYRRWDDNVRAWKIELFRDDVQKAVSTALGTFFSNIVQ